jgi:hypothetical protein
MNALWNVIHLLIFKNIATAWSFEVSCEQFNVFGISMSGNDAQIWGNELYIMFQNSRKLS